MTREVKKAAGGPGGRGMSSAFQLAPPLVVLKMMFTKPLALRTDAPLLVGTSAYSVEGLTGSINSLMTGPSGKPLLTSIQLAPPLVLFRTPRGVAAYNVEEFVRSITRAVTDTILLTILHVPPASVLLKRAGAAAGPPRPRKVCA